MSDIEIDDDDNLFNEYSAEGVVITLLQDPRFTEAVQKTTLMLGHPRWCIAGGFLRDLVLGVEPKDVDVYTGCSVEGVLEPVASHREGSPLYDHGLIRELRRGSYEQQRFEVIQVMSEMANRENARRNLQRFDCGLCMIGYGPITGFHISRQFLDDANNRTLTIRPRDWGVAGAQAHIRRLIEKYPEYRVVDPEGFLERETSDGK